MIPLSVPYLNGNEWKYIKECLDTNWVSSAGKFVNKFEELICKKFSVKNAVAVINGTSAIHLSLLALGIGEGDEVIVPTVTFIAPINAVKYTGAEPIFFDVETQYYNIDVNKIKNFLEHNCYQENGFTVNKKTGKRIKAIIPVHIFGTPCEMDELTALAKKYNLKIIEDSTESIGSKYKEQFAGTIGDIGCFSFNGNKIITTGGGGVVVTNDDSLAKKVRHLSTQAKSDELFYEHDDVGYNYRMTNITAAMGVAQLEQLDNFIKIKRSNAEVYKKELKDINGLFFNSNEPEGSISNRWFYSIEINQDVLGFSRNELMNYLNKNGIQCRPIWKLNHKQKPYLNSLSDEIQSAELIWQSVLNIPCSVDLKTEEIKFICDKIKQFICDQK